MEALLLILSFDQTELRSSQSSHKEIFRMYRLPMILRAGS
jgi:hypothetical protein